MPILNNRQGLHVTATFKNVWRSTTDFRRTRWGKSKVFYQIKTSELKQTRGRLDYWVDSEATSNSYISTIRRQAISVSQVEYNNHWERWLQIFTKDCHDIWKHENQPTFAWHLSVGLGSIFFGTFIFSVKSTTIRRGPRVGPAAAVEYIARQQNVCQNTTKESQLLDF